MNQHFHIQPILSREVNVIFLLRRRARWLRQSSSTLYGRGYLSLAAALGSHAQAAAQEAEAREKQLYRLLAQIPLQARA
ncbi:hypothetical protein HPC49_10655 [Pyxidicoccus fallax]|uniref:Uncharacterized protein n=1 Tax=Pyxidicoccus fallax TaxID=394095 RepID=A0A848LBW6_9BACT|nr:hypothetical protein [Pyxidicoccus fallax]NMO16157.1 hypothetical protein [Pyxidicoccus fallax]NPC78702.1 hypothetical protein [Pyxidicoccus fallax]